MYQRPYLDANIWINFLMGRHSSEPAHRFPIGADIFKAADEGTLRIVASTLLYAEVCKAGPSPNEADFAVIDKLILSPNVDWVEVDLHVARDARRLVRDRGIQPSDAIHVATAMRAGADEFLSWDTDKLIDRIQGLAGLPASLPHWEGQASLETIAQALPLEPEI